MMMRLFNLKHDMQQPNITGDALQQKIITSDSPIIEHNFGMALGSMYFVRPDDLKMVDALVKELNDQPGNRKTHADSAWIAGGGPSLLSLQTEEAKSYHQLFTTAFGHTRDFIDVTHAALDEFDLTNRKKIRLATLTTEPLFHLLAKGLFDVDALPDDLMNTFKAFSDITGPYKETSAVEEGDVDPEKLFSKDKTRTSITSFANFCHQKLQATHYAWGVEYFPQFKQHRDARDGYVASAKNFFKSQEEVIRANLLRYSYGEEIQHVLSLAIIESMKQTNDDFKENREHLDAHIFELIENHAELPINDFILTLPSNLFAAINIRSVLQAIIHALATDTSLLNDLKDTLADYKLESDLSNLKTVIETDRRENNLLHRIYLEGLRARCINPAVVRNQFNGVTMHYVVNPIPVNDTTIPAKSVVCVLNAMNLFDEDTMGSNLKKFDPNRFLVADRAKHTPGLFSYVPRRCPAFVVSEYIAKAFVVNLVMKYDFKLFSNPNEFNPYKILMEFRERSFENEDVASPIVLNEAHPHPGPLPQPTFGQ